jgi:putative ABC transport system permease protein
MAKQTRKVLSAMDPEAPLYDIRTIEDYLALDLGRARFQTVLLALFAGIALFLTAVGLYGVMSYTIVQRTQEIGIRVALGASRRDVLRMILARSFSMTGLGLFLGILGAVALTRLLSVLLYEIKPIDPMTFLAVSLLLGAVSLLASYIPAWRAARVDPMVALRYE